MAAPQGRSPAMDQAAAAFSAGRIDEALALCAGILREDASHFYALHLASVIALQQARWQDAVDLATRALAVSPGHGDVLANRGAALRRLGRANEALADYDAVLAANPAATDARNNRGVALAALGRHDEAIAEYIRAVQAEPGYAEAFYNLGVSLAALNRHAEAVHAHSRTLAIDAGHARARWGRALSLLALGRWGEGFAEYEVRHALGDPRSALREVRGAPWTGREDIAGRTVLLAAEQGYGDVFMFLRFARALHERGARVRLAAPAAVAPLVASLPFLDAVVAPGEPLPAFDYWCPLASLPARLGTTLATLPAQEPPLRAPDAWSARWRARLAGVARPRIGIAWRGGLAHDGDDPRALALGQWQALRQLPATFVALQDRIAPAETMVLDAHPSVLHFERDIADFRDTAAIIGELDLVVTVDTAVAHLAGAMGCPVWILLPFAADWRWLLEREDSPWYPSARLLRQPRAGSWEPVIQRVAAELAQLLARDSLSAADFGDASAKARVRSLLAAGRAAEAEAQARAALGRREDGDWLHLLGAAQHLAGHHVEAAATLERAVQALPHDARVRNTLGSARMAADDLEGALRAFDEALERNGADTEARFNRALASQRRGDADAALADLERLLAARPDHGAARLEYALLLMRAGRAAQAWAALEPLVRGAPTDPKVLLAAASARASLGAPEEAAAFAARAAQLAPEHGEVRERAADLLAACGRNAEAQVHYAFVATRRAEDPALLEKLASAAYAAGDTAQAIEALRRCTRIDPGSARASINLAVALNDAGDRGEAIGVLARAVAAGRDDALLLDALANYKATECDWDGLDEVVSLLRTRAASSPTPPGSSIFYEGVTAAEQRAWAECWSAAEWPAPPPRPPLAPRGARLRVGFLSGDFHAHATTWLVTALVEAYDRDRFEFVGYSYSVQDGTALRERLKAAFGRFVEVGAMDDAAAARAIRDDRIDILLDLGGHTKSGRLGVLAGRPAPIQGHFLGYPATTGASFVDFYVGDAHVAPAALEPHFSERIVRMPACYQPNAAGRAPPLATSREQEGLPRDGLVFCSFNQPIKITARVFAAWCELLRAVPRSVLWLLAVDPRAEENLRRAAARHGIDPARLVFAPRIGLTPHLARIQHADLALDPFPCGSHTTASDVIRAAVPMLTTRGETFASRVASSVLAAAGCEDWVFGDVAGTMEATLALARSPALRAEARERARRAVAAPLFDSRAYARAFEAMLLEISERAGDWFAAERARGVQ